MNRALPAFVELHDDAMGPWLARWLLNNEDVVTRKGVGDAVDSLWVANS